MTPPLGPANKAAAPSIWRAHASRGRIRRRPVIRAAGRSPAARIGRAPVARRRTAGRATGTGRGRCSVAGQLAGVEHVGDIIAGIAFARLSAERDGCVFPWRSAQDVSVATNSADGAVSLFSVVDAARRSPVPPDPRSRPEAGRPALRRRPAGRGNAGSGGGGSLRTVSAAAGLRAGLAGSAAGRLAAPAGGADCAPGDVPGKLIPGGSVLFTAPDGLSGVCAAAAAASASGQRHIAARRPRSRDASCLDLRIGKKRPGLPQNHLAPGSCRRQRRSRRFYPRLLPLSLAP